VRALLASKWTKVAVFFLCLAPFAGLVRRTLKSELGANPVEFLQHATGDWTLRFLVLTLCITPLRKLFNLPDLIRFRRMLGLLAFFYLCLHFLTYLGPDQSFDLSGMWRFGNRKHT
jgi:methionine sulfoxide reductase heme-binding subunit